MTAVIRAEGPLIDKADRRHSVDTEHRPSAGAGRRAEDGAKLGGEGMNVDRVGAATHEIVADALVPEFGHPGASQVCALIHPHHLGAAISIRLYP